MPSRIALLMGEKEDGASLSPFFVWAPWVMVEDPTWREPLWLQNTKCTVEHLQGLLLSQKPDFVVCGYVPSEAVETMREAGIDVRLGPCSVPARELINQVRSLPRAPGSQRGEQGRNARLLRRVAE